MQRITCFLCDCSLYFSASSLHSAGVSCRVLARACRCVLKLLSYMLRHFLNPPRWAKHKRGWEFVQTRVGKWLLCTHIFQLISFLLVITDSLHRRMGEFNLIFHFVSIRNATITSNSPDVILTVLLARADEVLLIYDRIDVESCSLTGDTSCCFLVKLHLPQRCHHWEMRCSDLQGWLENIIILQLWDTNYLWLLVIHSVAMVHNLSLYYLFRSCRTRYHPNMKKKKSDFPILRPLVFSFTSDQVPRLLMGPKCFNQSLRMCRHWNICQTAKWFVMQTIIHIWQHAEWLLWY